MKKRGLRLTTQLLVLVVTLLCLSTAAYAGQATVHYIDVGQGDSIYISLPDHIDILIDGGDNDYGDDVVGYLNSVYVDDIELIIATNPMLTI